ICVMGEREERGIAGLKLLFSIIYDANTAAVLAILRGYKGHVLQTTLDSESEAAIKRALQDEQ
ncbi:MAG: hypothetical protein P8169_03235, partial [Chloroflexota bacterium]